MHDWFRSLGVLAAVVTLGAQQPSELQILVIGGEGSINNVKQRTAREPVVEVRDRNNRPVAGALVLFEAPNDGASGTFLGGSRALRVTTDAQGRAVGQGFRPNTTQGDFVLQVTATAGAATAATAIHMRNGGAGAAAQVAQGAGHAKLIGIAVAVGAAAAAGVAYAATHGNGSSTATTTPAAVQITTITPGTGTVGGRP
jgi:hypothetical protein